MPHLSASIGLDIGHSTVKIACCTNDKKEHKLIFPSVAMPAFSISDDVEAKRAARETVAVQGNDYFYGDTALMQGGNASGLSENWIDSPEHEALLRGALDKVAKLGAAEPTMLVVGLPSKFFSRQRERLGAIISAIFPGEVKVVPQPFGPYQALMLDNHGNPSGQHSMGAESWGVVEIGYFTTDFMLMEKGRFKQQVFDSCAGIRVAAEHLARLMSEESINADLTECDEAIKKRVMQNFGKQLDVSKQVDIAVKTIAGEIADTASRLMEPYARKLTGVLVAGGGAHLVMPHIATKWPHAVMAEDPRFSVAEGMRRFGMGILRSRELQLVEA